MLIIARIFLIIKDPLHCEGGQHHPAAAGGHGGECHLSSPDTHHFTIQ